VPLVEHYLFVNSFVLAMRLRISVGLLATLCSEYVTQSHGFTTISRPHLALSQTSRVRSRPTSRQCDCQKRQAMAMKASIIANDVPDTENIIATPTNDPVCPCCSSALLLEHIVSLTLWSTAVYHTTYRNGNSLTQLAST
jgi:hypothetical protein